MNKKIYLLIIVLTLISGTFRVNGQNLISGLPAGLTLNGYIDTYIAYDNDKSSQPRQYSAIAPYRDEFRINLAMLALRYTSGKIRGNIALQFGDIPKLNWPAVPNDYMQFIQEANIGYSPFKNIWIDAGYFLTHIGGEGLFPKDNFFQSFSLCTYFEPLFQSGVKFSYTGKKFYGSFFILNGYSVLADNNKNKSVGLQLGYKPNEKAEITYNNIVGNEMPPELEGKTRIYNNIVVKLQPAKKLGIILCGDFCAQEKSSLTDPAAMGSMFSGFVSAKYRFARKFSAAIRGEIFQDKDAIFSSPYYGGGGNGNGLKATGVTGGIEFNPAENSYFRLESRYLIADKNQLIFYEAKNTRLEVILSGGLGF